jgi:hypothetical protein
MEDFSKDPGGQDLNREKSQYAMFVDGLGSKQVFQYVMKLPQATWIETFLEGVTDKSTGLTIFKELAWFTVSGVISQPSNGLSMTTVAEVLSVYMSLVSCTQRLHVSTVGLSRDGFSLKEGISSIRR